MPNNLPPDVTPEALNPLREWASPRQIEAIDAVLAGGIDGAAETMGIAPTSVQNLLSKARRKAAARGHSPRHDMVHTVPDGFAVKGVSTFYNDEGQPVRQWVKSERSKEAQLEALQDAIAAICEPVKGKAKPVPAPMVDEEDLMVVVPWGDPHIGMLAHHEEAGENFDTEIACRIHYEATDKLIALAPPAKRFVLASMGDLTHDDIGNSRTPASGHVLDTDTRFPHTAEAVMRLLIRCIDRALEKYERVTFIPVLGNHDPTASFFLGMFMRMYYEREPRVDVDDIQARSKINYLEHGKCLLAFTHGDTMKMPQVPSITAASVPEMWGRTKHRHGYTAHVHHDSGKEFPGMMMETIRIISGADRYSYQHGYRSQRDMKCDVWHRDHGMILRHRVGVAQLGGA